MSGLKVHLMGLLLVHPFTPFVESQASNNRWSKLHTVADDTA
jgi:hypothetical protein